MLSRSCTQLLQRRAQSLSSLPTHPRRCLSTALTGRTLHLEALTIPASRSHLRRFASTSASPTPSDVKDAESLVEHSSIPQTLKTLPEDTPYHGPLTATFRRLKIFSLSSLTLTFALTPFIFIMETTSAMPLSGRCALAGVAIATSGVSTALVAWCGQPYVTTLRWIAPEGTSQGLEMTTLTLALHERTTRVYDTAFLVPSNRPFATWELAEAFQLPSAEIARERGEGALPREETIAETTDWKDEVVGRWIVKWDEHGVGTCRTVGRVPRYFNVHQDLLNRPIR